MQLLTAIFNCHLFQICTVHCIQLLRKNYAVFEMSVRSRIQLDPLKIAGYGMLFNVHRSNISLLDQKTEITNLFLLYLFTPINIKVTIQLCLYRFLSIKIKIYKLKRVKLLFNLKDRFWILIRSTGYKVPSQSALFLRKMFLTVISLFLKIII